MLPDTTLHAGYARYLSPPPFELVGGKDIALFQNTTSPPLSPQADSPLAERANYYDIGLQQKVSRELTLGLDTYAKQSSEPDRRGAIRRADHPDTLQLPLRQAVRRRGHRQLHDREVRAPT